MIQNRRSFLKSAGIAAAGTVVLANNPSVAKAAESAVKLPNLLEAAPDVYQLGQVAIDAAMEGGAQYADIRFTLIRQEEFDGGMLPSGDHELLGVGVRVLANGYWGFMGSAVWNTVEMVRLGKGAVSQAIANGAGLKRESEIGAAPPASIGEWHTPVKYDPFDVPKGEKIDFSRDLAMAFRRYNRRVAASLQMSFQRQEKVFMSSDGSRWFQTTYVSGASLLVTQEGQYSLQADTAMMPAHHFSPSARGWEYFCESDIYDDIPRLAEDVEQMRYTKPVDANRYTVVLSAQAMAALIDPSIGAATELDRAMGYEANATGSSYLNKPLEMIGNYKLGTSLLNVDANRTRQHGLATVKWDDESVLPQPFTIIEDGILKDFQTTRQSANWLAPYYNSKGIPVASHGCANAQSALFVTTQHSPNLSLKPSDEEITFDDLVKDTKDGIAVMALGPQMDHQQLNGMAPGAMREIKDGKLGRYLQNAGILFRSPELWRNLNALAGQKSQTTFGFSRYRGQPRQYAMHSVSAVPGRVTNIGVIDVSRKA